MGCCCPSSKEEIPSFEVEEGWSEAVLDQNLVGMQYLYADEPEVLHSYVTPEGEKAIHIAAKLKNYEIVTWLCEKKCEIDEVEPVNGWSALHYAADSGDLTTVQTLLSFKAATSVSAKDGRKPVELSKGHLKTQFKPAVIKDLISRRSETTPLLSNDSDIHVIWKQQEKKKKERRKAKKYEVPATRFAVESGIELDAIAEYFEKLQQQKETFWQRCLNDATSVTKDRDLYKLFYLICTAAIRKQLRNTTAMVPKDGVRLLTKAIKQKYRTRGKNFVLKKQQYLTELATVMFSIHDQWEQDFDYKSWRKAH